jgi:hypothetical protein
VYYARRAVYTTPALPPTLALALDTSWARESPSSPMTRALSYFLCAWMLLPSLASAEEHVGDEQWLVALRHSGSYQEGVKRVREKLELSYDMGAVNGASHWETIHDYYVGLARAKGCKKGTPYADGPVKACHKVSKSEPKLLGAPYKKGRDEIVALSLDSLYPDLVRKVLFVIYDYGYVQGMKHVLRKNNDDLRWAQSFYRSCVARANDAAHEPVCASASKAWSDGLLKRLRREIEAHGLPAGKKSK